MSMSSGWQKINNSTELVQKRWEKQEKGKCTVPYSVPYNVQYLAFVHTFAYIFFSNCTHAALWDQPSYWPFHNKKIVQSINQKANQSISAVACRELNSHYRKYSTVTWTQIRPIQRCKFKLRIERNDMLKKILTGSICIIFVVYSTYVYTII